MKIPTLPKRIRIITDSGVLAIVELDENEYIKSVSLVGEYSDKAQLEAEQKAKVIFRNKPL